VPQQQQQQQHTSYQGQLLSAVHAFQQQLLQPVMQSKVRPASLPASVSVVVCTVAWQVAASRVLPRIFAVAVTQCNPHPFLVLVAGKAGVGDRRRQNGQAAPGSNGPAAAAAAAAPPKWFVTADELNKVPSYMRGRLTLDKVRRLPLPVIAFAEECSCKHTAVKWAVLQGSCMLPVSCDHNWQFYSCYWRG
jgi:hypothetical protein